MNTSNTQRVDAANSPTKSVSSSCCGGPAPAETDACCAKDAEVKSTGGAGCGCGAGTTAKEQTMSACCT